MEAKNSKPGADTEDSGTYELDLSEGSDSQVDDIINAAMAAVEEKKQKKTAEKDSDLSTIEEEVAEAAVEILEAEETAEGSAGNAGDSGELEELRNRLMRTLADFDNFRKRTEKEKEAQKRFAVTDTLKDFLSVSDNLDRALASSGTVEELKQGVEMILRQQAEILKRWGVVPVKAVGEPFNPAVHEAVAREDSTEVEVPTVTGELQRGFMIHDRLLRPAMVSVAMPAAPAPAEPKSTEGDSEEAGGEDSETN